MKNNINLIIFAFGVLMFTFSSAFANLVVYGPTLTVEVVNGQTGLPIEGAKVRIDLWLENEQAIEPQEFVTGADGLASSQIPYGEAYVSVDAEGYTSSMSNYGISYVGATVYVETNMVYTVTLVPGEPKIYEQPATLILNVVDEDTGNGIYNAQVYFYIHDNQYGVPDEAVSYGVTNEQGTVVFEDLSGEYNMGIIAEGYTSDRALVINPDQEAEVVYSYFGFVGVASDYTLTVELSSGDAEEDWVNKQGFALPFQVVGLGLAGFGGINYLRRKKK